MPHVTLVGARIHYQTLGDGPPVALCYCLGGNLQMWGLPVQVLARRFRVITWDPRGHGGSDSPQDPSAYGISRSAHDLAGLLDHLGYARAHVGGLSMGGGIAARFAQLYPDRALSLTVIDSNTAAGQPVSYAMRDVREHTIALCVAGDMDAVARYYLANSAAYRLYAADSPLNRERLHAMIAAMDPTGFANTLRAMLSVDGTTADLALIRAPTLVLAGEHDPAMAAVRITHAAIPGAALEFIPGAGHLSNIDAPDQLAERLLGFLERVSTR